MPEEETQVSITSIWDGRQMVNTVYLHRYLPYKRRFSKILDITIHKLNIIIDY